MRINKLPGEVLIMNRNELAGLISKNIQAMNNKLIGKDTHEWYLHNHLENLLNVVKQENNASELLDAGNKFLMFCTDSMNWDTCEFKSLVKFGQSAIKIAKSERNNC